MRPPIDAKLGGMTGGGMCVTFLGAGGANIGELLAPVWVFDGMGGGVVAGGGVMGE